MRQPVHRHALVRLAIGAGLLLAPLVFAATGEEAPRRSLWGDVPQEYTISVDPSEFVREQSRWDSVGPAYEGNPVIARYGGTRFHAFGKSRGRLVYEFELPGTPMTGATVEALLSSEFPGYRGPADGQTEVRIVVNGQPYDPLVVETDDGAGKPYSWTIVPGHLKTGKNTLAFEVPEGAKKANGLCIFGRSARVNVSDGAIWIRVTTGR